jgi:hypothetical protein
LDCNQINEFITYFLKGQYLRHGASLGSQIVVGLNVVLHTIDNQVVIVATAVNSVDKVPGTGITIFIPIRIIPRIDQWVSCCFHELMSNDTDSSINSRIAIGRCVLCKAVAARSGDSNPAVLVTSRVSVPTTEFSAETWLSNIAKTKQMIYILKHKTFRLLKIDI